MWKNLYEKVMNIQNNLKFFYGFCICLFFSYYLGYAIGKFIAHIV